MLVFFIINQHLVMHFNRPGYLISQAINTLLITLIANKFMPIGFEWKKIFTVLIIASIFFIAGIQIGTDHKVLIAVIRILLLLLFPLVLYKLNLFEPIEILRLKEGILKLKRRIYYFPFMKSR